MIDEKRIADFFAELVSIDSPSLEEREMADTLKIKFAEIGVTLTEDHTQEQTVSMRAICSRAFRAALQEPRFSLRPTWTLLSLQKAKKPSPMRMEP